MAKHKDPTEPIRMRASRYPGVAAGTSCTQSSFKTRKAFLYIGPQGGRYKAMFTLEKSLPEATRLAREDPDRYEIGPGGRVTARFPPSNPFRRSSGKSGWMKATS